MGYDDWVLFLVRAMGLFSFVSYCNDIFALTRPLTNTGGWGRWWILFDVGWATYIHTSFSTHGLFFWSVFNLFMIEFAVSTLGGLSLERDCTFSSWLVTLWKAEMIIVYTKAACFGASSRKGTPKAATKIAQQ